MQYESVLHMRPYILSISTERRTRVKIDRLYAVTVYLLNHGKTSASVLARRFEVPEHDPAR